MIMMLFVTNKQNENETLLMSRCAPTPIPTCVPVLICMYVLYVLLENLGPFQENKTVETF
jgi:hypothetical protein